MLAVGDFFKAPDRKDWEPEVMGTPFGLTYFGLLVGFVAYSVELIGKPDWIGGVLPLPPLLIYWSVAVVRL